MCVCVCVQCTCVCSLLLGNLSFNDPHTVSLSTSCLGDCKVARVGWPTTDFKLDLGKVAFDHASHAMCM